MTFADDTPVPEPRGDLVPPVRHPPTAVGAATPPPEPRPPRVVRGEMHERPPLVALVGRALTLALDALDVLGDAVAERLGVRRAAGEPPAPPPQP